MLLTLDGAFYRRLAVTAAALAVYRLGCAVPVPGLAADVVSQLARSSGFLPTSVSVCALGVVPLITVLILAELLRTLVPGLRRWELASPGNREFARLCHYRLGSGRGRGAGDRRRRRPRRLSEPRHRAGRPVSHHHRRDDGRRPGAGDRDRRHHRQGGHRLWRAAAVARAHARRAAAQPRVHRRCLQRRHLSLFERCPGRPIHRLQRRRHRRPPACRARRRGRIGCLRLAAIDRLHAVGVGAFRHRHGGHRRLESGGRSIWRLALGCATWRWSPSSS